MTDLSSLPKTVSAQRLRQAPTFTDESRHCGIGIGCTHFKDGTCRHPQAEWSGGHFNSRDMRLRSPENRWPKKEAWEWCGWWRPPAETGGAP